MAKTVFIAHPISGDILGNMRKVIAICRDVHTSEIIPVAPYLVSLTYLDDHSENDRRIGIEANMETFSRKYIDELWLYGDRISQGMWHEVLAAQTLGIPVVPMSEGTKQDFADAF